MKLAILNSFAFHYEMFGHIIEYCLLKNIRLDIYTNFESDLGWISFYILKYIPGNDKEEKYYLNKQEDKLIRFYPIDKYTNDNDYTKIILTTDDDIGIKDKMITDKFICIDHHFNNRRPQIPVHISIRDFKKNIDWTFPVYKIISVEQKKEITKPIITCIGRFNCSKDISKFKNLFNNFETTTFAFVDRHLNDYSEIYKAYPNINCYPSLNTTQMFNLLIQSDYVFVSDENEDHCNVSLSGVIPLGLNSLCNIIMPKKMNEGKNGLHLKSAITYTNDNKIELTKPNFDLINLELEELIKRKFGVFDKHFNEKVVSQKVVSQKVVSQEITNNINNFDFYMIVKSNSDVKYDNFKNLKSLIPSVNMFDFVDSNNNYDNLKLNTIKNNIMTAEYLCYCDNYNKQLEDSLSHLSLWKNFLENSKNNWLLVLEDTIKLNNYNAIITELLIGNTDSHFIQLISDNPEQLKTEKINFNLHKMIENNNSSAYLINKKGIEIMMTKLPFYDTIGNMISKNIDELKALCFVNNIFVNSF
jgi:hypothetical protein